MANFGISQSSGADNHIYNLSQSSLPFSLVVSSIYKYNRYLICWIALWVAIGIAYITYTPPQFSATASIILNPSSPSGGSSGSKVETGAMISLDNFQAESQMQVLKSERILSSVFNKLDLAHSMELPLSRPMLFGFFQKGIGPKIPDASAVDEKLTLRKKFEAFVNRVNVKRVGNSYVFEVSFQAYNPIQSATIANAICMQYIASQVELRAASIQRGTEYLQGRIASTKAQLAAAEDGVKTGTVPNFQFPDADAQVISSASPPLAKSSPKLGVTLALVITLAVLSGVLTIIIKDFFDASIKTIPQIKHLLGIRNVVRLPRIRRIPPLIPVSRLSDESLHNYFGREYRRTTALCNEFYTNVVLELSTSTKTSVGFVSWTSANKKSLMAQLFTSLIEKKGHVVSLVHLELPTAFSETSDSDQVSNVRSLSVSDMSSISNGGSSMHGPTKFHDGDFQPHSGEVDPASSTVFSNNPEYTVYDFPPVSTCPDIIGRCSDMQYVVLVIDLGKTPLIYAERVVNKLRSRGLDNIGVIAVEN